MVADGQALLPPQTRSSFAAFLQAYHPSPRAFPKQALLQSASSCSAFPMLPALTSGRSQLFTVAATITRLFDALLSQVVAYVRSPADDPTDVVAALPPLISLRDSSVPAAGCIEGGSLQLLAAAVICIQSLPTDFVPTALWLYTTAAAVHESTGTKAAYVPHITSVACLLSAIRMLLQSQSVALRSAVPPENCYDRLRLLLSCTLERCSLQQMLADVEEQVEPTTALQWAALIAKDATRRPQKMHAVVPCLLPLLDTACGVEAECMEAMLKSSADSAEALKIVQQLQHARAHVKVISERSAVVPGGASFAAQLPCMIFLVQHMQGLWAAGRTHVEAVAPSGSDVSERLSVALANASVALKLQLHAPEAHLLRTEGGTMPLPADPAECEAWVELCKLAAGFAGLHALPAEHIVQALGRAGLQIQVDHAGEGAEGAGHSVPAEVYVKVAAQLACSSRIREMLVEGAALCIAAAIQEDSGRCTEDASGFVHAVLARSRDATAALAQASQMTPPQGTIAATPTRRPIACDALQLDYLAMPLGCSAQRVLSQLESLAHGPAVLASLTHVTVAASGGVADVASALMQLQAVLRTSTCYHPLLESMTRVLMWCSEQDQPPPADVLHGAWRFWHFNASDLHAPLPDATPLALASALPRRLAELVARSVCPQRRHAFSMHLSPLLPLCLQHLLQPEGMAMEDLPVHRAALAQALRSLLSLSVRHASVPVAYMQELARITALAGHTLAVYRGLCGPPVAELSEALCQAATSLQAQLPVQLQEASARCATAAAAAVTALGGTVVPALRSTHQCLTTLLQCIADAASDMVVRKPGCPSDTPPWLLARVGHAGVRLAAWRAQLLLPPPGLDPAMVSMERQRHIMHIQHTVTEPTQHVARMAQKMPLIPDQTALIARADAEAHAAALQVAELEHARVPRPSPSQYDAVVSEAERCFDGLLQSAQVAVDVVLRQAGSAWQAHAARQALMQGYSSVEALAGWCANAPERFPLYADQLSPFLLAVLDVQRGLATACVALEQKTAAQELPAAAAGPLLRSCLMFPLSSPYATHSGGLLPLLDTVAASSAEDLTAHLQQATLACVRCVEGVPDQDVQMLPATLGVQQELQAQLLTLRVCALHAGAPGLQQATMQAMHGALQKVMMLWRTGNELREELQRREECLYKTKHERIVIRTDDEDMQVELALARQKRSSLFADLLGEDMDLADPAGMQGANEDTASGVARQLSAVLDNVATQEAMVAAHAEIVKHLFTSCGLRHLYSTSWSSGMQHPEPCTTAVADMLSRRAHQILESCGGHVPADINAAAAGGAIRQLLSEIASLYPQNPPGKAQGVVDVMSPCLEEKALAVAAVSKLQQHIALLLERFPEQPLLEQFQMICKRILGMPSIAPLKDAMVGVELLVTRVQEWQNHNASVSEQTTLADHQVPLAALCARWRQMELASWSLLVDQAVERERRGAWVHWFHLVGLIFAQSKGVAPETTEVLAVVEQYLQSSPLGQFETRIQLLGLCAAHCAVLVHTGQPAFAVLQCCLQNVAAYYALHLPAVRAAVQKGLEPVLKEMKDFVALQKWEHQGTVDLKLNIEKSQRKLTKCRRQAAAAVSQMVTPVFARLAGTLGIDHVQRIASSASGSAELKSPAPSCVGQAAASRSGPSIPAAVKDETAVAHDPRVLTGQLAQASALWIERTCRTMQGVMAESRHLSVSSCCCPAKMHDGFRGLLLFQKSTGLMMITLSPTDVQ
eukprot:jgi/Ulvmu1/4349/UM002_0073.1